MAEANATQGASEHAARAGQTTAAETVQSTSDERTVNNVMRHQYRVLTDKEKQLMQQVKDDGLAMFNLFDEIAVQTSKSGKPNHTRELSLAKTKIEEAVMWAVKHITA